MKNIKPFVLLVGLVALSGCGSVLAPAERETAEQEIQRVQQEERAHFQSTNE